MTLPRYTPEIVRAMSSDEVEAALRREREAARTEGKRAALSGSPAPRAPRPAATYNDQVLAEVIAVCQPPRTAPRDQPVTVPAGVLRTLIDYAHAGDQARWNRLNHIPDDPCPLDALKMQIEIKLAAMAARREIPALRGGQWEEREAALTALAEAIARTLDEAYVFAPRIRTGRR